MYIEFILPDLSVVSFEKFINFDYKINSSSNDEILLGNCSAASLDFSVWNADKRYNAYKFKKGVCHLYRDNTKTERIGIFNVDKVEKENNSLVFRCTDNMTKFQDETFKGIQTPYTIFSLLVQLCTQLGFTLKTQKEEILNSDLTYNTTDTILGKSCREVLKFICEVTCSYAIFDENGELCLCWYDLRTIKKEIPYNQLKTFKRDEAETQLTGVSVMIGKEEITVGEKSGYDLLLTKDNPFLSGLSSNEIKIILENILGRIQGMKYLSCDISLSVDKNIKIGDVLKIYDEDGEEYKIIVSYLNISKIFSMSITSAGENLNRKNDTGQTGGDTSSSGGGEYYQTAISKDENWRDITINTHTDTFLNGISLFGITEKSSALLCFSLSFYSNIDTVLKFKININGAIIKEIYYDPQIGLNVFSWTEEAILNYDSETNIIKVLLSTEEITEDCYIKIYKNQSILTVVSIGATVDGGNRFTKLEIKESIKGINLINFGKKNINTKTITDTILIDCREYYHSIPTDIIVPIAFKTKSKMSVADIEETIT